MSGLMDKAKGNIKEAVGSAVDNKDLEADGKMDQAKGHAKAAAGNVAEGARNVTADAKDAVAEKLKSHSENAEQKTRPS